MEGVKYFVHLMSEKIFISTKFDTRSVIIINLFASVVLWCSHVLQQLQFVAVWVYCWHKLQFCGNRFQIFPRLHQIAILCGFRDNAEYCLGQTDPLAMD
jgi:hypothetical protein